MEIRIIWPDLGWNIAFAIACVLLFVMLISQKMKENDKTKAEISKIASNILQSKEMWAGICLVSLFTSFIITLYLLHQEKPVDGTDDMGYLFSIILYIFIGLLLPGLGVAICQDEGIRDRIVHGFVYAAGNALVGFVFLIICTTFSNMWIALCFLLFDIFGAIVTYNIDWKN